MKEALRVLNDLEADGTMGAYAIGGAMGAMFYAEPTATYDLDIFVLLPKGEGGLITLTPIYDALRARGYAIVDEHLMVEGVPVQFLPAYNALLEEALGQAETRMLDEVPTRVLKVEHLIAIAIQTDRAKDHLRVHTLLSEAKVDLALVEDICKRHGLTPPPAPVKGKALWTPPKI